MTLLLLDSKPPSPDLVNQDLAKLLGQLHDGGVKAALKFLNQRVAHRFTAIFKFQGDEQRTVFVYDKLGLSPTLPTAMPIVDTSSQPATASRPFTITAQNSFPGGHAHCLVVRSYFGVPLSQAGRRPAGSLCHLDFNVQAMPAPEECVFIDRAKNLLLTRLNGFQS